jgi:hypothetical protein
MAIPAGRSYSKMPSAGLQGSWGPADIYSAGTNDRLDVVHLDPTLLKGIDHGLGSVVNGKFAHD